MARWTNLITRQESTGNKASGGMVEYRGLVVHTADGTYEGTISWQKDPASQVSSHFIVGKSTGQWCQVVDDVDKAWTQKGGNGHWLSVENEGHGDAGEALTPWQIEANAQILAEAHRRHGVPLQIATDPNGHGLGHHSMGGTGCTAWDWGHCGCPGQVIINQKAAIVSRAQQIIAPAPVPLVPVATVAVKALVNGSYVSADGAGKAPLIANRATVGPWEQFELIELPTGYIALRAKINGLYVCADNAGKSPLIANRHAVGTWESFTLIHRWDGTLALRALANNRIVTNEQGKAPMSASRDQVSSWEVYALEKQA